MICYMLIINMPLWINVYLRNKNVSKDCDVSTPVMQNGGGEPIQEASMENWSTWQSDKL